MQIDFWNGKIKKPLEGNVEKKIEQRTEE